mgnify:CR=1 FL=1
MFNNLFSNSWIKDKSLEIPLNYLDKRISALNGGGDYIYKKDNTGKEFIFKKLSENQLDEAYY